MKKTLKSKIMALVIAVLLVVGMSPAASAASIIIEKSSVKVAVGAKVTLFIDYTELEELEDDNVDVSRARVYVDKSDIAQADFGSDGADLTVLEITGVADGQTTLFVKVGRYYSQVVVTVGRGNKSPAQIKKEEEAKKAEEAAIKNDKSALGAALTEAIKKAPKKEVSISTTTAKDPVIPVSTLKALAAKASQAKKYAIVRVDSLDSNGKVQAQLYVDPAGLTSLKSEFKTGVTTDTSRSSINNYIASVKCAHTGSFGTFTEIAVKVNNAPKDATKIAVFNVGSDGKLKKIEEPSCSYDKNGLLHFYSREGGEIVLVKAAEKATEKAEE